MGQIKRKWKMISSRVLAWIIIANVLGACQDQNENLNHKEHQNQHIKGTYLNFEELEKKNPNSAFQIQKISENKNYKNKNQNQLKINRNSILEIQTDNFTSYTIQAFNTNQLNIIYNYVITVYPNEQFSQYLIQYPILENDIIDYQNASVTKVEGENLLNRTTECAPHLYLEDTSNCIYTNCKASGNHEYGDSRCRYQYDPRYAAQRICDMVTVGSPDCEPGGGSSDNNDHGEGGDYDLGTGGSNNSGSGTGGTITLPVYDDLRFSVLVMGLDPESQNFINHSDNLSFKRELEALYRENEYSEQAETLAKGQIELEVEAKDIPWIAGTGTIANKPHLKYTHYRHNYPKNISYFKMTDGSEIAISGVEKALSQSGDLIDKYADTAGVDFRGKFYYIKVDPNGLWGEMLFDPQNLKDELETLFALGGIELGQTIGRYVLPIEDIKIIIDGKDFDGQEVARWKAAGFLLLTVVPGSKALKVVKGLKVVSSSATKWGIAAVKANGKSTNLIFKVVNGVVEFGSSSKLATIIGTNAGQEAHHIIPWAKSINSVIQKAARAGFHMNAKINGIALQKYSSLTGAGLHGNHPAYNTFVERRLQGFINNTSNLTPEVAKDFLERELIPDLLDFIELAKNSGMNLNDYFKTLI